MDAFVSPLHELGSFEELERASAEEGTVLSATGCMDAQKPHMMYGWNNGRGMRVIVTFNEQKARELLDAYRYFDRKAVYFPAKKWCSRAACRHIRAAKRRNLSKRKAANV